MHQAEEDLLVIAAQNGNLKAFDMLYRIYHKPLLRFAFRLGKDMEIAKDAVQETWIKSAGNLRKIRDPRAFKSWIYRLVRWRTLDLLRKQVQLNEQFDEFNDIVDEDPEFDDASELTVAISRLPQIEKQVIHLFYLEEMRLSEIAVILEIPVGTVKSQLNRARKLLKQKFDVNRS